MMRLGRMRAVCRTRMDWRGRTGGDSTTPNAKRPAAGAIGAQITTLPKDILDAPGGSRVAVLDCYFGSVALPTTRTSDIAISPPSINATGQVVTIRTSRGQSTASQTIKANPAQSIAKQKATSPPQSPACWSLVICCSHTRTTPPAFPSTPGTACRCRPARPCWTFHAWQPFARSTDAVREYPV